MKDKRYLNNMLHVYSRVVSERMCGILNLLIIWRLLGVQLKLITSDTGNIKKLLEKCCKSFRKYNLSVESEILHQLQNYHVSQKVQSSGLFPTERTILSTVFLKQFLWKLLCNFWKVRDTLTKYNTFLALLFLR